MARLIIQLKTGGNRRHPVDRFGNNCGGTDGEVEIRLRSRDGQNGPWIILNNSGDDRERGSFDTYGRFDYPFGIFDARSLTIRFRAALSRPDDDIAIDDWHLWFLNLVEEGQAIARWEPDRCLTAPRNWQGLSFPIRNDFKTIDMESPQQGEVYGNFEKPGIFISLCDFEQVKDSRLGTETKYEDRLQPIANCLTKSESLDCSPHFQGTWSVEYLGQPEYSGQMIITFDGDNLNINGTINRNGTPDGDYTGHAFRCEKNGEGEEQEHIAFFRYQLSSGHEGQLELVLVAGTTDLIIGQYIDDGNGDRGVIEMWKLGSERFSRRTPNGFFADSDKRAAR